MQVLFKESVEKELTFHNNLKVQYVRKLDGEELLEILLKKNYYKIQIVFWLNIISIVIWYKLDIMQW